MSCHPRYPVADAAATADDADSIAPDEIPSLPLSSPPSDKEDEIPSPPLSSPPSDEDSNEEDEIPSPPISSSSLDKDSNEEGEIPTPPLSSSPPDEDSNEEDEIPSSPLSSSPPDEDSNEEDEMTSPPISSASLDKDSNEEDEIPSPPSPLEDDASNGVSAPPQESGVSLDASTSEPQCDEASCIEDSVDPSSPGISSPSLPAFFEFISSIHCAVARYGLRCRNRCPREQNPRGGRSRWIECVAVVRMLTWIVVSVS